jgi:esterase/lipase
VRRLLLVVIAALVWVAPAQAISKQSGQQTMTDGTKISYDLYLPDGTAPSGGWPAVIFLHGLGGSKADMAPLGTIAASQGYAALAYSARGQGTSTGDFGLAGPNEISDERAMFNWLAGLPEVSDTQIGAWGVSYGGGETWNGLAAGIPYKAAEVLETWTDLYSALWPQGVAKSGVLGGFAKGLPALPKNPSTIKALADSRSALSQLSSITTPVYMFQGRVDYAFDVTQAENGFLHVAGPKHLYIGQFGHQPSSFPGPDVTEVLTQGLAWFDHYLKGAPNGIDTSQPVTIAAATGPGRASFAGLPPTKVVGVGFRGTALTRVGPRFKAPLETFGVSVLKVQVRKVNAYPQLVATVLAGSRVITHGAIVPKRGLATIRLANYVQYLPKGTRLSVRFGPNSGRSDFAYVGSAVHGTISLGPAFLSLQTLTKPISR